MKFAQFCERCVITHIQVKWKKLLEWSIYNFNLTFFKSSRDSVHTKVDNIQMFSVFLKTGKKRYKKGNTSHFTKVNTNL